MSHNNLGTRIILDKLFTELPHVHFLIVETTGLYSRKSLLSSIFKLLREASFKFCLRRFLDLIAFQLSNSGLRSYVSNFGHRFHRSGDVNSQSDLAMVKAFEPDILIMLFTMQIAGKELLKISKLGSIGCHPSNLTSYRGLETFFWQLCNNETLGCVSIFSLEEKIDLGRIIEQQHYAIDTKDSLTSHYLKLSHVSADCLVKVLQKILNLGVLPLGIQVKPGKYYPMPTRSAYRKFSENKRLW